jgi:V8-like Glu-specific endopeptidase
MGEYRELLMQAKRQLGRLTMRDLAMIGTAVAVASFFEAIGAPPALAQQPSVSQKTQVGQRAKVVRSPVSRRKEGEVIDFANAHPMPLPESTLRPASLAEAMLEVQPLSFATPRSREGAPGNGRASPVVLVPAKKTLDEGASNEVVPQEFGTGGLPYTTSQVNAFFDDTDVHYPFSAAGKLFYNVGTNTFVCSASLIARGVVVTAAHCVGNFGQNQFYANWQYVPAYNNGVAPYGVSTAKSAMVLSSYLDGTDPCAQAGVICQDDVAVITLNPLNGTYVGTNTGWLGVAADGYGFTGSATTQITQLGYPVALDGGQLMERTDSLGYVDINRSNNTIIGSLMTGGSSGGPWVVNLGLPPSLSGTAFGQAAAHNLVGGVTSWGFIADEVKLQGASPFTSGNVFALLGAACNATPAACQ